MTTRKELMEPTPDDYERRTPPERFSARTLMVAVLSLLVVVLVMAFSLVYASTIAATAQDSAQRQEDLNDKLRIELDCRAKYVTEFDLAKGDVMADLGDLVIHLSDQKSLLVDQAHIKDAVARLRAASSARAENIATCSLISASNGG